MIQLDNDKECNISINKYFLAILPHSSYMKSILNEFLKILIFQSYPLHINMSFDLATTILMFTTLNCLKILPMILLVNPRAFLPFPSILLSVFSLLLFIYFFFL